MNFLKHIPARSTNGLRAIVDIGSNTVRVVIYSGPARAPVIHFHDKVSAQLGRGVAETGMMTKKAMAQAFGALSRFARLLELRDVAQVEAVATAAVRDAANGADFLAMVRSIGLQPRLLSGEEEAVLSAMGVAGAFPGARGVVADLGGGSLELIDIDRGACDHGVSLPLGTLRLPQLRDGGGASFARRIHKVVQGAGWSCREGETLYLVGGSHRALAAFAMNERNWPVGDEHGFELTAQDALELCRSIMRRKTLASVRGISSARLNSLPDVAALLNVLMRELHPARLVFSSWGLREGLLFNSLTRETREQDPLISGVTAFAESQGVLANVAAMVAGWTAQVSQTDCHRGEKLRLAAIMLALSAQKIEPNLRADHAVDWALRKRWIGIDAQGRAQIAACVLANAGRASRIARFEALADTAALRQAQAWGLALRICRRFSGICPQTLSNSALRLTDAQLILSVREPFGALCTEIVEKDMRQLGELLGVKPDIRILGANARFD